MKKKKNMSLSVDEIIDKIPIDKIAEVYERRIEYRTATASLGYDNGHPITKTKSVQQTLSFELSPHKETFFPQAKAYSTVYLGLLARRYDVFGGIFNYPRCHFSGFYMIDEKGELFHKPIDKRSDGDREHRSFYADKDRIIAIGSIAALGCFVFWWDIVPYFATETTKAVTRCIFIPANVDVPVSDDLISFNAQLIFSSIGDLFRDKTPEPSGLLQWKMAQPLDQSTGPLMAAIIADELSMSQRFFETQADLGDLITRSERRKASKEVYACVYIQKAIRVVPLPGESKRVVYPGNITPQRLADVFAHVILDTSAIESKFPEYQKAFSKFSDKIPSSKSIGCMEETSTDESETENSSYDDIMSEHIERLLESGRGLRQYSEPDSCGEDVC